LIQSNNGLHLFENFQIKYGREGFKERNNFLHTNFFIFEMGFELNFGEFKVYFNFRKLIKIARN
jgi:hypothetical protein